MALSSTVFEAGAAHLHPDWRIFCETDGDVAPEWPDVPTDLQIAVLRAGPAAVPLLDGPVRPWLEEHAFHDLSLVDEDGYTLTPWSGVTADS